MIKPFHHPAWLHASSASWSWSVFQAARLRLPADPLVWIGTAIVLAYLWLFAQRRLARLEDAICRRVGIEKRNYSEVLGHWSIAAFGLSTSVAGIIVLQAVFPAIGELPATIQGPWWLMPATLALAAGYAAARLAPQGTDATLMGTHPFLVLMTWWVGTALSPSHVDVGAYLSVATGILALLTIAVVFQRRDSVSSLLLYGTTATVVLGLLALFYTSGSLRWSTAVTFLIVSAVFFSLAALHKSVLAAQFGCMAFTGSCLWVAARIQIIAPAVIHPRVLALGLAALIAAYCLAGAAGRLQPAPTELPDEEKQEHEEFSTAGKHKARKQKVREREHENERI